MSGSNARRYRTWAAGLIALAGAAAMQANADTIYVDGSCGNDTWSGTSPVCVAPDGPKRFIRAAIESAVDGDEVVLLPGIFWEGFSFLGKAITVRSTDPNDPSIVAATVVDAIGWGIAVSCTDNEGSDTVLSGITLRSDGAGMSCYRSSPTVTLCTFAGNEAGNNGGGIRINQGDPTLTHCLFIENSSVLNGGGIYNRVGDPVVSHCLFIDNSAVGRGGGIYSESGNLVANDCTFSGNSAEEGGGIAGTVRVTNCTFVGNSADAGGGMFDEFGTPLISDSSFLGNLATGGAGVFGAAELTRCTFIGNVATGGSGGGVLGRANLFDCTFTENSANRGGGVQGAVQVTYCTFSDNWAGTGGGGGMSTWQDLTVVNCVFTGNSTDGTGGAIYNESSSPLVVNCVFSDNSAATFGGGIYVRRGAPRVSQCTFSMNAAPDGGGAMYNESPAARPLIQNCILWNDSPNEITGTFDVTFSDLQGGWPGTGNIDNDPRFVDPVNENYRISAGSPCIDAASNFTVPPDTLDLNGNGDMSEPIPFDHDGAPRFVDDPSTRDTGNGAPPIVDMGAYEFQGDSCNPCDMNCDGDINAFDIEPFLDLLFGGGEPCAPCTGDVDGNGEINAFDIEPFLECLFP